MGIIQKDAFRTMLLSYAGIVLGYVNKVVLFLLILSTEQIGLINLLITVGTLFATFSNFGASFSIWKFLPFFKNKEKNHHGFFQFSLLIVTAGITVFTLIAFLFRGHIEEMYLEKSPLFSAYYIWMLPIGIAYAYFNVIESYLRSFYHNIIAVVAYEIVLRLGVTAILILIWAGSISFELFVILNSLLYIVPTFMLIIYLQRKGELHLNLLEVKIPKKFRNIILQFSSFYYVNTLGIILVTSLDMLMIGKMMNEGLVAVGVYSTIVFVASALQVPYKSIIRISSPIIAELSRHKELGKMQELYQKVSSVSLVLGLGMFILFWVNIDFLFSFLKPEFSAGIWAFFFLMAGRLVDMYSGLNGAILTTSKKYRYDIFFTLFLIFAVFYLNTLFIPVWGITGAAISTSIALIIYSLGRVYFVWYVYRIHFFAINQLYVIALGVMALLFNWLLPAVFDNKWLQMLIDSAVSSLLFFGPLFYFKLEPETIGYFQKGWKFIREKLAKDPPVELP